MMSGRGSLRLALVGRVEGWPSPWRSFRQWVRDRYHLNYTTVKLRFLVYLISRRAQDERSDEAIPNPAGDCFAPFGRSQ
jgi:hypothetical protein